MSKFRRLLSSLLFFFSILWRDAPGGGIIGLVDAFSIVSAFGWFYPNVRSKRVVSAKWTEAATLTDEELPEGGERLNWHREM